MSGAGRGPLNACPAPAAQLGAVCRGPGWEDVGVCVGRGGGVSTLHLPDGQQSSLPKVTGLGRPGYLEALWR